MNLLRVNDSHAQLGQILASMGLSDACSQETSISMIRNLQQTISSNSEMFFPQQVDAEV